MANLWPRVEVGRFHANRGIYVLDLDIIDDLSPSNSSNTGLQVVENGGRYGISMEDRNLALLSVFLALLLSLLFRIPAAVTRRQEWNVLLRQWVLTQPGPLLGTPVPGAPVKVSPQRKPKQVAARSFSVAGRFNLNRVMLVVVQLLMLLWVVLAVLTARPWAAPHGLPIRTVRPGVKLLPAAGIMPLRIRVLGGSESNYRVPMRGLQIGSQIIDRTHFSEFLRREIPKRPSDWPVYIEADRDLEYESVAWTIDAVSAFRAKVILLTPGLKADLGEPAR